MGEHRAPHAGVWLTFCILALLLFSFSPYSHLLATPETIASLRVRLDRRALQTSVDQPQPGRSPRPHRRDYDHLSADALVRVIKASDPKPILDHHHAHSFLSDILIPRVPDTPNIEIVRKRILGIFTERIRTREVEEEVHGRSEEARSSSSRASALKWHIETPTFEAQTPEGRRKMTNLIITKNPAAPRKLLLAAHYDSKWFPSGAPEFGFVGATDSAAPCAMLVDVALALDEALERREKKLQREHTERGETDTRTEAAKRKDETTLQLVFFDGEEAFHSWTHTDSIYGAKALASNWTSSYFSPSAFFQPSRRDAVALSARRYQSSDTPVLHMDTIDHLILLDLLGAPAPKVPSYFAPTQWLHEELAHAEERLRDAKLLNPVDTSDQDKVSHSFFSKSRSWGGIEDDHLPFVAAGVPVLHIIPSPFPSVWHTKRDDASALHYPTVHAWSMIMRLVVAEYLSLEF